MVSLKDTLNYIDAAVAEDSVNSGNRVTCRTLWIPN